MNVRGIVLGLLAIFYGNIFEIAHGIERGIAIQSAIATICSLYLKKLYKLFKGIGHGISGSDSTIVLRVIGIVYNGFAVAHAE